MAYCTKIDLQNAVSDSTTIDVWSGDDEENVNRAINSAQSEIDGYLLSGGYNVPLNPVPDNVKNYAADIALYNLVKAHGIADNAADKALADAADKALKFFQGVAAGKFRIPTAGTDEVSQPAGKVYVKADSKLDLGGYM